MRDSGLTLTKEELIKLKHSIEPYDYQVVDQVGRKILVIRSELEFPDIVNDLEIMINKFDMRDINQIAQAMIIGDAEVVGIPVNAINSLLDRRIEDDEIIAADLEDKLDDDYDKYTKGYGTLKFNYDLSERSNGDIKVKMTGDFDRTTSYWSKRDSSDFRAFIEDTICDEIDDEFKEDIQIYIYDEDDDKWRT